MEEMGQDYNLSGKETVKSEERQVLNLLGSQIRYYRKLKNLTQEQLGELAQVSYKYIGEIERGRKKASVITIYRMACALQVTMGDLLNYSSKGQSDAHQKCMKLIIGLLADCELADVRKVLQILNIYLRKG
jgi:transcriptional regulator with XRE-family HTH domain